MESIILNDRYKLEAIIGEGGMATTYKGQDLLLSRTVAIKIMREQYANNSEFVDRFRHEAQAAARVQNENIAGVYDTGFDKGSYYLVMEYVQGTDLKQRLRSTAGPLPILQALSIAEQIASGLAVAHKAGLVHRDIKPHNILINNDGKVKITDFGIAKIDSDTEDTGVIIGSVHYISPEQVKGETATEAADIYSLGAVLYEMLTGRTLFDGDTAMAIAQKQVNEVPTPISVINPGVPKEIEDIADRALEKEPRFRYQNAGEFASALKRAILKLSNENTIIIDKKAENFDSTMVIERPPAAPTPPPQPQPVKEEESKGGNGGIIAILLIAILLLGGIAAYITLFAAKPGEPDDDPTEKPVPYVVNMKLEEARGILRDIGFTNITTIEEYNDTVIKGNIISQYPKEETKVEPAHTKVELTVSKGPELFPVPDVTGQTEEKAKEMFKLNGFNFTYKTVKEANDSVRIGSVIRTDPEADSMVPKKSTITLYIASQPIDITGPNETTTSLDTTAPLFRGKTEYYVWVELVKKNGDFETIMQGPVVTNEKISVSFKKSSDNILIRVKAAESRDDRANAEVIQEYNL